MELYDRISEMIRDGVIVSAYALDSKRRGSSSQDGLRQSSGR